MFRPIISTICLMALPIVAAAEGDAAKGEKVFRKCKACHAVGEGAENKVGPVLNGIVGRQVGTIDGFKYSDTLIAMSEEGVVWSPEELDAFLIKPRDYAKGTKMSFAGLRKEDERVNVIAYLATFPDEGS
ncbi:cytochrome c family protein [Ruegeria sp. 2205SS24-7]|uniref:c-type cytochrome n=1 Tax=Ruegeria discodermiae TaxID=3064389 RepID=UPI00274198DA|nr:cytochrome c family protein [Ruegeria sp. 2205SS24-7]MDP5217043.1 cytochrome c family protein [Ruegeria sp. 2205SS24-7]